MLNRNMLTLGLLAAGLTAGVLLHSVQAQAGEIYSWRTEDGAYAFTDDPKAIPARYRDRVETRTNTSISNYARLTAPEPGSGDAYAARLAQRLDHLRGLNRDLDAAERRPQAVSAPAISVDTGELNVGLPTDEGTGPVVIENVRFRHRGEIATRHNKVVRKGDTTVAVIKGKRNVGPVNQDPEITHMVD